MKIKKINKNHIIISIIILIIIIFLIVISMPEKRRYTFKEGFQELEKIDKKYNTNFKIEAINSTMADYKNIEPLIEEITFFRERIIKQSEGKPNKEEQAILLFIEIRMLMLRSQQNFILANSIGNKGIVTDKDGFACSESGYIINSAYYFNLSFESGILAINKMDDLLNYYRDVPFLWDLVGIEDTKPKFYISPFGYIKEQITKNTYVLENFCFLNMSQGLSKINPEDYINMPYKTI